MKVRYLERRATTATPFAARPVRGSMSLVLLILVFLGSCESGIIVHDPARAAELIVDCLSSFKSRQGIQLAYDWTDDQYKQEVSFAEFRRMVASIRNINQGADIRLNGYETFGAREVIIVYANANIDDARVYYKFTLVGTRPKDYYLLDLNVSDSSFGKTGIFHEYREPIVVGGV